MARKSEEVLNEYNNLAFKAGNLQYQISQFTKDLDLINNTLRDLNLEFNQIQKNEAEVAKKIEEVRKAEAEKAVVADPKPALELVDSTQKV